jgi:hypothetical protein
MTTKKYPKLSISISAENHKLLLDYVKQQNRSLSSFVVEAAVDWVIDPARLIPIDVARSVKVSEWATPADLRKAADVLEVLEKGRG